jgi:Protein kinase domain
MVAAGYRIDGTLGEGGMGTVYRATQLSLERVVALKVLTVELSSDPAFRERFRREGLLQAALEHPHIVTVYEAGEADERLFLAMRMVEGPTLKELIQRRQLDDRRALRLLTQVAEALDAAHARGLIHRDVKPHNVLVGAGDHAYLADFGLTKAHDDAAMTETGQFVGTIDYISPEQARGELATARSDVYALTAVLCECLTGQVPYVRATEDRVLAAHLSEPAPRLSEIRSDLPPAMDDVVAEGMAKDPAARPATAGELMLKARRALAALPAAGASAAPTRLGSTATATGEDAGTTRLAATAAGATRLAATAPGAAPGAFHSDGASASAPPAAAAQHERASAPAGRRRLLSAALVAAVLAGAAGFLLAGGSSGSAESFGNSASVGSLELAFPTAWQRLANPPAIRGLTFSQPLALAAGGKASASGQSLLAGEVNATGASLLPSTFTSVLAAPLPHAEPVQLGTVQAYRYRGLSVRGLAGPVTLYAVPTAAGVATIACLSASPAGVTTQCAQIAATLKLTGTTAFGLGPSAPYATSLNHVYGTLHSAAASASTQLRSASSAVAQAAAAAQIAAAYSAASSALARLSVSPAIKAVNASLASSLAALAADYSALAAAARAGDDAAYAKASSAVASDRVRAQSALSALGQAGYEVSG